MNARQYIALLEEPAGLHNVDLTELQEAVKQYPYVGSLQALLLKKYQLLGMEDAYVTALPRVALTVPDRAILHAWVQRDIPKPEPATLQTHVSEMLDEAVEEATDAAETEAIEHALHIVEEDDKTPEEVSAEPETTWIDEPEIEDSPAPELDHDPSQKTGETNDEEDNARATGFALPDMGQLGNIAKAIGGHKKVVEETKPAPAPERLSFVDWLKQVETGEVPKPKDELDDLIMVGSYEAALVKESATLEGDADDTPEADDADATAMAERAHRSAQMADENVTETLALILEMQKKYDKAVDAYKKLIVRFPEKREHFEAKIKLIENK